MDDIDAAARAAGLAYCLKGRAATVAALRDIEPHRRHPARMTLRAARKRLLEIVEEPVWRAEWAAAEAYLAACDAADRAAVDDHLQSMWEAPDEAA